MVKPRLRKLPFFMFAGWSLLASCQSPAVGAAASQPAERETAAVYDSAVRNTLEGIRGDLVRLSADFPQLTGIENATLRETASGHGLELQYKKGVGPQTVLKAKEPQFEKDGCWMTVEIVSFRPEKDTEVTSWLKVTAKRYELYELPDGLRYVVWWPVRAEGNEAGHRFVERAYAVIRQRLDALHEALKARRLPQSQLPAPGS